MSSIRRVSDLSSIRREELNNDISPVDENDLGQDEDEDQEFSDNDTMSESEIFDEP